VLGIVEVDVLERVDVGDRAATRRGRDAVAEELATSVPGPPMNLWGLTTIASL
jgi:hypothetical protein